MDVQLKYSTAAETPDWSVPRTFLCADKPGVPIGVTVSLATVNVIVIDWAPPASDGGSPVLGYDLYMKKNSEATFVRVYEGFQNPATTSYILTSYNSLALETTTYDFKILTRNWVGDSDFSTVVSSTV